MPPPGARKHTQTAHPGTLDEDRFALSEGICHSRRRKLVPAQDTLSSGCEAATTPSPCMTAFIVYLLTRTAAVPAKPTLALILKARRQLLSRPSRLWNVGVGVSAGGCPEPQAPTMPTCTLLRSCDLAAKEDPTPLFVPRSMLSGLSAG